MMAAAKRDFAAIQSRREQRARDLGFSGYSQQRRFRADAAKSIPGNTRAEVKQRDTFAVELRQGGERIKAGSPKLWTDHLVDPKWGTSSLADIRGEISGADWLELDGLMEQAYKSRGGMTFELLEAINEWLIEHDMSVQEWWAEFYGR